MTLQTSGPIKASEIEAEFGGTPPFRLSDYYAGGPNVPAGTSGPGGAVPSSGAISFSDFYGTSNFSVDVIGAVLIDTAQDPANASVGYRLNSNGDEETFEDSVYAPINTWLLGGSASDFECRMLVDSGTTPAGSATNSWLTLASSRAWTLAQNEVGVDSNVITIQIRLAGDVLLDSAEITMNVEVEFSPP